MLGDQVPCIDEIPILNDEPISPLASRCANGAPQMKASGGGREIDPVAKASCRKVEVRLLPKSVALEPGIERHSGEDLAAN